MHTKSYRQPKGNWKNSLANLVAVFLPTYEYLVIFEFFFLHSFMSFAIFIVVVVIVCLSYLEKKQSTCRQRNPMGSGQYFQRHTVLKPLYCGRW